MALDVTPIYRNLRTRVTFFGLEAEDLFAILAVAVVMNICGRFLNREMFGLPMNMVLRFSTAAAVKRSTRPTRSMRRAAGTAAPSTTAPKNSSKQGAWARAPDVTTMTTFRAPVG